MAKSLDSLGWEDWHLGQRLFADPGEHGTTLGCTDHCMSKPNIAEPFDENVKAYFRDKLSFGIV